MKDLATDLELSYWKIRQRHWKEEPESWSRKYYRLQEKGYQGYYISNYSPFELNILSDFLKKSGAYRKRTYRYHEQDHVLGRYYMPGFSIFTKETNDFESLMKSIPKRNNILILPLGITKPKFKTSFNHCYVKGEKSIALSYNYDGGVYHEDIMKLTIMKLTG